MRYRETSQPFLPGVDKNTMRSSSSSLAIISLLALSVAACGSSGSDSAPGPQSGPGGDSNNPGGQGGPDGGLPKAEPIGKPTNEDLTEKFGVFVSPSGTDDADGTRAHPLARIQPAIDLAKTIGKRVYVCTGVYREALVVADSISVIGGLDCSRPDAWETSATTFSRIEAPSSPALLAKDITSPTRLEGLDVLAPNASAPSGSSIGLLADHAGSIVVARSKITAGNGVNGADGTEGTQLANGPSTKGAAIPSAVMCGSGASDVCLNAINPATTQKYRAMPNGGAGGTNTCVGAPGHVAPPGGAGGSGGLYQVTAAISGNRYFGNWVDGSNKNYAATSAPAGFTGAPGADGVSPSPTPPVGKLSASGYVAADGSSGTDGTGGAGGSGGKGSSPSAAVHNANNYSDGSVWQGWGGGGGGAGGCPGLAGTAGKGGGASIAAALIESPITFDGAELTSGRGGDAGKGTLGSLPTVGGLANNPEVPATYPGLVPNLGQEGGRGGAAGVSNNGSSGPSVAIAHVGAPPKLVGAQTMKPGAGGASIPERTRTEGGVVSTIPATPAGVSKDILAL